MRTPWTLFFALVFAFYGCWRYVPLANILAQWIGFVVVVSTLSYWLARYLWSIVFVSLVSGEGKAVLVVGCDTGFGYFLVKSLCRAGFFVFAGCLDATCDGANELKKLANVKVLQLDISSERQVSDALVTIKDGLGSKGWWTNISAPLFSRGLTTEDLKKNCPEVADDFTQKEIDSWIDSSKNFYDILNRENLQEVADVMVLAVRETDPRTWYTTPWSLCTAVSVPFHLPA
ncbi:hypothetical protein HPB52_005854 [Rhipicephalus sanguineus]|uniref:Uncharacterized protein n=1 Tax=Rhipicephalus sanguineus TaxID=34632 RepID=A0A9D4PFU7_RHISA|nr:hypothetical protein HPB52_005854 [Rhipicephalus sanguineus]